MPSKRASKPYIRQMVLIRQLVLVKVSKTLRDLKVRRTEDKYCRFRFADNLFEKINLNFEFVLTQNSVLEMPVSINVQSLKNFEDVNCKRVFPCQGRFDKDLSI